MKKLFMLVFCIVILSGFTFPQEQYGHIRGKVTDSNDEPLPGVTVTLECPLYGARHMTSTSGGTFRFLNLATGSYSLKCVLPGFKTYVQEKIVIRVGDNFDFPVTLEPAALEEEVTVVASTPIVDTKKTGTAFNVTEEMLQDIPSARDPWVILQQAPGIMMTRENVGGIDSATQSAWTSKGTPMGYLGNYNLDGVNITDMVSLGSSSRYYDFDSFEEIQIVTTGQDPSIRTSGVSINFVTRRGGNKFEILGRFFFTNDKLQSDNRTQELIDLDYAGDQINQLTDYGLQAGGPILRDRLWFWMGYGVQDIRLLSIDGYPNDFKVESVNAKLNFQLSPKDRGELAFVYNDKSTFNQGIGPYRPLETTTNQIGNGNPLVKLEYERMFSDAFLMTLKLAHSWGWFGYDPNGGLNTQAGYDYYTGMYSGTLDYGRTHRPSYNAQIDGNYFLEAFLGGDHEFKFGAEYRLTPDYGEHIWPGGVRKYYWNGEPLEVQIHRCLFDRASSRFSFYLNDAYSLGRLTINLGLRVDRENFWNDEVQVPANPIASEIMPGFTLPRIDVGVILWTFSPRFGLTFDLTGDGKTILRANAARYGFWPDNLAATMSVTEENRAWYDWNDLNGDDLVSTDELVGYPYDGLLAYSGYNPFDPTNPVSPYEIAEDLPTGSVDELLLGIEREIFKDFSVSVNFTLRKLHDWNWWVDFNRETSQKDNREDWGDPIQGSITVDGTTYDYEYWAPETHRFELPNVIFESWNGWSSNYTGIEFIATKRLSHRWMMNASFTIQQSIEHYREGSYFDPTNHEFYDEGSTFFDSRWMAKINFLYQLPWGFNFSGFANVREGRPFWSYLRIYAPERRAKGVGSYVSIRTEKLGETRYPNFYNVDLSLSKDFVLGRYGRITFQVDAFNVFNFSHTLGRYNQLNSPSFGEITQILNPRVIRLGIRYRF